MTDETDITPEEMARMWAEGEPVELHAMRNAIDARLAAYYEAHKDDPAWIWDDAPEQVRRATADADRGDVIEGSGDVIKPRRMASMLSFRLAPEDMDALRDAVEKSGLSLSAFIREAALRDARKLSRPVPPHSCNPVGCKWCNPLHHDDAVTIVTRMAS